LPASASAWASSARSASAGAPGSGTRPSQLRAITEANRYFAGQEPWTLRKTDPARMAAVLYTTAEVLRAVGLSASA
jgi:hypothetical protein